MAVLRRLAGIGMALSVGLLVGTAARPADAQSTLRVVMHSDLKIVDPIWTTAYITRNHGYMIYDTLFAMDAKGEIRPQMVDKVEISPDKLTYTFTLRDGLLWHDGTPVTAEDCVASIKRWSAKDSMGQKMMSFVKDIQVANTKTFRIVLKEQTGLVLSALGKPSSNVPFMMPKRVADTDPNTQISDFTGSGPFVFKRDEWKPGDKAVYAKFAQYKPRSEAPSGLAGGKVAKVDRVEWRAIADHQTAINALLAGEIDYIESPPHDLYPVLKKDAGVRLTNLNPLGNQYTFRFNTLSKPFDNTKVRQAVLYSLNQEDFLKAVIGDPAYYKVCRSLFPCGTPLESTKGMEGLLDSNFEKSKALLKEAGYDGTPIVLMHSTDLAVLANLAPVAKSLHGKGRLQGRHAVHGLADLGGPPRQEGSTSARGLARLSDLVGGGRYPEPGDGRLPERELRQGACSAGHVTRRWRLCATSSPARAIPPSRRPSPSRSGPVDPVPDPRAARPVVRSGWPSRRVWRA